MDVDHDREAYKSLARAGARHRTASTAALTAEVEKLRDALRGLLLFAEDAETKRLVGDEGCLWPVEAAREALREGVYADKQ